MSKINYVIYNENILNCQQSKIIDLDNGITSTKKKTNAKSKFQPIAQIINLIKKVFPSNKVYTLASPELKQYYRSEKLPESLERIEASERAEKYKSAFLSNSCYEVQR